MATSLMKNKLFFASFVVLSITAQAEDSLMPKKTIEKELERISGSALTMPSPKQVIPSASEENNSNLWKMLDTDSDGSLSRIEATASKDVFNNWNKLDKNKDNKLDENEFVQVFYQDN